jgi:hypothetical protein
MLLSSVYDDPFISSRRIERANYQPVGQGRLAGGGYLDGAAQKAHTVALFPAGKNDDAGDLVDVHTLHKNGVGGNRISRTPIRFPAEIRVAECYRHGLLVHAFDHADVKCWPRISFAPMRLEYHRVSDGDGGQRSECARVGHLCSLPFSAFFLNICMDTEISKSRFPFFIYHHRRHSRFHSTQGLLVRQREPIGPPESAVVMTTADVAAFP